MIRPRFSHLADIIYRKYPIEKMAGIAVEIEKNLPDFAEAFNLYFALESASMSAPNQSKKGTVYFMRDTLSGEVKIGFSDGRVWGRAKYHANHGERGIETLLQIGGTYADETKFHEMFKPHNIKGEWYKGTDEVLDAIKAMGSAVQENPGMGMADIMIAAGWKLFFWKREAECYRELFARHSAQPRPELKILAGGKS